MRKDRCLIRLPYQASLCWGRTIPFYSGLLKYMFILRAEYIRLDTLRALEEVNR